MRKILQLVICSSLFNSAISFAQTSSKFDHHEAFAPIFYPAYGDEFRSASGAPGPKYWQNRADYKITAVLDDVNHSITASVTISYKNNSPEKLPFVWLQLDQNIYNPQSRGVASTATSGGRWANRAFEGGYEIRSVVLIEKNKEEKADYEVNDTRMQIRLSKPMKANSDSITIKIDYSFTIP